MIPDHVSVTRLAEYFRDRPDYLNALNRVLIEERESGEYAKQFGMETIGELRNLGRDNFKAQFSDVDNAVVDWLFDHIKRKPGRPRKAA